MTPPNKQLHVQTVAQHRVPIPHNYEIVSKHKAKNTETISALKEEVEVMRKECVEKDVVNYGDSNIIKELREKVTLLEIQVEERDHRICSLEDEILQYMEKNATKISIGEKFLDMLKKKKWKGNMKS